MGRKMRFQARREEGEGMEVVVRDHIHETNTAIGITDGKGGPSSQRRERGQTKEQVVNYEYEVLTAALAPTPRTRRQ